MHVIKQCTGRQRGNALIMVLIGVALFAALTFAVMGSRDGSVSRTGKEDLSTTASEMISYANSLRTLTDKMLMLDNVQETNAGGNGILFAAAGAHADYGVPGTQPRTEIFHASGGGSMYVTPPAGACASACAYEFTGQMLVTDVNSNARYELALVVPGLTLALCQQINKNLQRGWTTVPTEDTLSLERFNGKYGEDGTFPGNQITLTGTSNEFNGLRTFCYREAGGGQRYIFVNILRGR